MKNKWFYLCLSFCIVGVLFAPAFASALEYLTGTTPLLGPIRGTGSFQYTEKYKIAYNTQGLNRPAKKDKFEGYNKFVLIDTPRFLKEIGAGHLVEQFLEEAKPFVSRKKKASTEIDEAYLEMYNLWVGCGGKYASIAIDVTAKLREVTVTFEPIMWKVPSGWAVGTVEDGRRIRVVGIGADRIISDPAHASLRLYRHLLRWEIGNMFMVRGGLWNGNIKDEVGHRNPCEWYGRRIMVNGQEVDNPRYINLDDPPIDSLVFDKIVGGPIVEAIP